MGIKRIPYLSYSPDRHSQPPRRMPRPLVVLESRNRSDETPARDANLHRSRRDPAPPEPPRLPGAAKSTTAAPHGSQRTQQHMVGASGSVVEFLLASKKEERRIPTDQHLPAGQTEGDPHESGVAGGRRRSTRRNTTGPSGTAHRAHRPIGGGGRAGGDFALFLHPFSASSVASVLEWKGSGRGGGREREAEIWVGWVPPRWCRRVDAAGEDGRGVGHEA